MNKPIVIIGAHLVLAAVYSYAIWHTLTKPFPDANLQLSMKVLLWIGLGLVLAAGLLYFMGVFWANCSNARGLYTVYGLLAIATLALLVYLYFYMSKKQTKPRVFANNLSSRYGMVAPLRAAAPGPVPILTSNADNEYDTEVDYINEQTAALKAFAATYKDGYDSVQAVIAQLNTSLSEIIPAEIKAILVAEPHSIKFPFPGCGQVLCPPSSLIDYLDSIKGALQTILDGSQQQLADLLRALAECQANNKSLDDRIAEAQKSIAAIQGKTETLRETIASVQDLSGGELLTRLNSFMQKALYIENMVPY